MQAESNNYTPICLLNVSSKVFTKVGTNGVSSIAHKVVRPSPSAFLLRRNILEEVVVLHETINEIQTKNGWSSFQIDFENAYDKIK